MKSIFRTFLLAAILCLLSSASFAQIKVSALEETTTPAAADVLLIVKDGVTKKVTGANLTKALQAATASLQGVVSTTTQTFAGPKTLDRIIIAPTALSFDQAANVLATGMLIPRSASQTVATGKLYDHIRFSRADGSFNIFDIQGTGVVSGLQFQLQASGSSGAASNLYGVIGQVSTPGPGTVKAIYGRATLESGATGAGVAGVFATQAVAGATAWVLQLSGSDNLDAVAHIQPEGATADFNDGFSFASGVRIESGGAFLKGWQTAGHTGYFLKYLTQASAVLFGVDADGNVTAPSLTLTTPLPVASGGTGASSASAARTALGLVIGTNVEAWDADLDALA